MIIPTYAAYCICYLNDFRLWPKSEKKHSLYNSHLTIHQIRTVTIRLSVNGNLVVFAIDVYLTDVRIVFSSLNSA